MSYPSDYRYLPFSDTTNYVSKTEYHHIPATSPYEVRLNEVPQKASPSTMTVKIVTSFSGGSPVYGATMTEVSATPASGEYYPDYYTEADGDSNWNTGTIQFNSANAGTLIEVTYMATGGLASVGSNHYPSWYTDRGDGSDGVFAPTENTTLGGEYNYSSVSIPSGVTITCSRQVWIKCQGGFTNNGTIVVTPNGGAGGPRGLGEDSTVEPRAGGAGGDGYGWGGQGGAGGTGRGTSGGAGGGFYSSNDFLRFCGSGGGGGGGHNADTSSGDGGRGGGAIFITATNFINNGTIQANGEAGVASTYKHTGGGGGGGGGCIGIFAIQIQQGTLTANGGAGGTTPAGGNGTAGVNGTNGTIKVVEV